MTGKNLTGRLAQLSARRRWTVLGAWVVVLLARKRDADDLALRGLHR